MKFPEDDDSSGDNGEIMIIMLSMRRVGQTNQIPLLMTIVMIMVMMMPTKDGFQATWAPSEGRESAMVVVDTIHGVGLENPSEAQNSGTIFVPFIFWRRGNAESGWRTAES